jgi:hypothetical protein
MTIPLLSDSEMAALRGVAEQTMQTSVRLMVRRNEQTADGQRSVWTYTSTVKGWVHGTPTPTIDQVGGLMATVNLYRVFLPVGTAIAPGDHVVIGGDTYTVEDTTAEDTWRALLDCSMRRLE